MSGNDFVLSLITASEKAAAVARSCRQNSKLLSLLVEQKPPLKRDNQVIADFKTLADVLIQELIRRDIEKKFPLLKGSIYGEEENVFTNALGEKIMLVLNDNESNTRTLLTKILNGDVEAARSLSSFVHVDIPIENVPTSSLPCKIPNLDLDDLALWIDPIDSTNEYINGNKSHFNGPPSSGLECVTVLIGAFSKTTGLPVVGVVNQPFYEFIDKDNFWKGRCVWGFSLDGHQANSVSALEDSYAKRSTVAVSNFEGEDIRKKLADAGFDLISASGAGNKCLHVILGVIDAYVLSQDNTYYWDTCGCQAILKSVGGDIWNYKEALKGSYVSLKYGEKCSSLDNKDYANKGGFIAYRKEEIARRIVDILK